MQLKSLEIQGFKSFPDRTKMTFGNGITAVVGPNGSGKSNISDAVRWVLGEKSSKSLRGKKMEDVIFNGTALRKQVGFAEVTLTIDNSSRQLSFDADDVAITRRYYRSGESEYQINGNTVRLKDILELFMDTGLGQDGYSIIGQGRISEIVAAKSDERREIFEEAAGISKFRAKKEESERHLAVAQDNLLRLTDILGELEDRVGPLKDQSEKAKKYLTYAGEKNGLEIGLALITLDKSRDQLRDIEYKLTAAKGQYDAADSDIDDLANESEQAYLESQKITAQIEEIRKGAQNLEDEAKEKEAQVAVIRNDIARDGEIKDRILADIGSVNSADQSYDAMMAEKEADIEKKCAEINKLEDDVHALERELLESVSKSEEMTTELEEQNRILAEASVAVSERRVKISSNEQGVTEEKAKLNSVKERLELLSQRLDVTNREAELLRKEREGENERLTSFKNSEAGYSIKLNSRRNKLEEKEEEVRKLGLQLSEKLQRAEMLSNLERSLEGFAGSVKTVMKESENGHLRGIIGPVSRIISVDAKYSTAIETALGGALQDIVVNDENDAKSAISYLKQQGTGRATFLPLTSVKGNALEERGISDKAGFVGLGYKLVEFDSKYEGIVKSLLGRIVVATDMNSATNIARANGYKFKIVTLDGQVINAGGSYTGGAAVRNAGLLTRSHDIEKLNTEAEGLQQKLNKLSEEKKALAVEVSALEAEYLGLKSEMQTANENLIRIDGDLKLKNEQCESAQSMIEALTDEIKLTEEKIVSLNSQIEAFNKEVSEQEIIISAAETKVNEMSGGRSEILRLREEQAQKVSEINMEMQGIRKDIEMARETIADIEKRKLEEKDKVRAFNEELSSLEEKAKRDEEAINTLLSEAEKLRSTAKETENTVNELISSREKFEKRVTEITEEQKAKYGEKEKLGGEVGRLEERKANLAKEYDKIIEMLLEEHQLTRSEAEQVAPEIENPAQAQKRLTELKGKIKALGSVNVDAIEEYKEVNARYTAMKEQYEDVCKSRDELTKIIADITGRMKTIFSEEFVKINLNFSETFRELFGGGNASLKLSDKDDVLSSGIEIEVAPPGKIINNLSSLSGGEQALVAMAIYFAILKVRPAPFCILDEVETALDDANVARFAQYLHRITDNTQFIAITHRRGTMEEADVLYGVTMQEEGVTKLLVMNVDELDKNKEIKAVVR